VHDGVVLVEGVREVWETGRGAVGGVWGWRVEVEHACVQGAMVVAVEGCVGTGW